MSATARYPVRSAVHAGSWYSSAPAELAADLDGWLAAAAADPSQEGILKAIIAPHAGYRFSGPTAARSYVALAHAARKLLSSPGGSPVRIVVLGPSHKVFLRECAVSGAAVLETPLGRLLVDTALAAELVAATGGPRFRFTRRSEDEGEHSVEMQLSILARCLQYAGAGAAGGAGAGSGGGATGGSAGRSSGMPAWGSLPATAPLPASVSVLPIMVGALTDEAEGAYGKWLSGLLAEPATLAVISTDFCHWGRRFSFSAWDPRKHAAPHAAIEELDRRGMRLAEQLRLGAWQRYIYRTGNTVCGRHPVAMLLAAVRALREEAGEDVEEGDDEEEDGEDEEEEVDMPEGEGGAAAGGGAGAGAHAAPAYPDSRWALRFVAYAQSSRAMGVTDSSVSYAAAVLTYRSRGAASAEPALGTGAGAGGE